MSNEQRIDKLLNILIKSGSQIDYLKQLKEESLKLVGKDYELTIILNDIANEIKDQTEKFLNQKNKYGTNFISGISTCIYFPDYNNNGEYKLKLIGGTRTRDFNMKINETTMFDIASITKLYLLILLFKLEDSKIINLDSKIADVNPDFQKLEDFTFNDLIRLCGELKTEGNISQATSSEEAYKILKTLYLSSNSRTENKYNDFGAIVLGNTIEKIISKKLKVELDLNRIMEIFLFSPLGLTHTEFNPASFNLSGNGNNYGYVHDPKARILGGAVGSAGIFTTSDDLAKLAKCLYSVNYVNSEYFRHNELNLTLFNKEYLKKLGEITFPNSDQSNKGNLGIYVKHPSGYSKTFTPKEFSKESFSHQGWTGAMAAFDPNNLIHNNILVNAIYEDDDSNKIKSDKPLGFGDAFEEYQMQITKNIMLMWVVKKYYNKYLNVKDDINNTKYIK